MKVLALHRLYQRTCTDCGYHWTVGRAQVQLVVRRPRVPHGSVRGAAGGFGQGRYLADMTKAAEEAEEAQLELVDQFRRCAKCGSEHYSQRPVTKRNPADPPQV